MYEMLPFINIRTANLTTNKVIHDSWFDKKIYTGSRSLYDQLQRDKSFQKAKLAKRKYQNRSRYRATPFGLFSSVKLYKISETNNSKNQMLIQDDYTVYTNIDSEWTSKFISIVIIENLETIKVKWNANVIYQNSNFIYNTWPLDDKNKFSSNKINMNNLVESIRDNSKNFTTLKELSKKMEENDDLHLPSKILINVAKQLVKGGYLITDIDNLTFIQNFELLIQYLVKQNYKFPKSVITEVQKLLKSLNNSVSKFDLNKITKLENLLSSIVVSKNYLRYDSETKVINFDFDKKSIEESILPLMNFLSSYAIRVPLSERYLADVLFFKEKYGNTKVKFLDFYKRYQLVREKHRSLEKKNSTLEGKIKSQILAFASTANKMKLTELDISKLSFKDIKIESEAPPAFQACCHLQTKNNQVNLSLTSYAGNNGLGRLEGRFSYMDTTYFSEMKNVEKNKLSEANTEIITIKYMPKDQHYYNIMNDCYEENLNLQFGTAENDNSVSLENLFIGVHDNKLIFFTKIDKIVRIVKFEQYNVSNIEYFSPSILSDLLFWSNNYYSNILSLLFDIQNIRKDFIYFPKIHFKGIELFPQSWLIKNYLGNGLSKDKFLSKFEDMKKIYNIPDCFFIRSNDMKVLIDANCKADLEILWDIYKADSPLNFYLEENSIKFSNLATIDSNGNHYLSEFVFNFVVKKINQKKIASHPLYHCKEELNLKRKVNWIHFNIYLPYEHQNDFLGLFLYDLLQNLTSSEAINNFFFIRYFDDRHHIRVRFFPSSQNGIYLLDKYLADGVIKGDIIDYSLGKYEPEYERYGGLLIMSYAEDFFFADSLLILSLLNSCLVNDKIDKVDHAIFLVFRMLSTYTKELNLQFEVMNDGYSNKKFSRNYRENRKRYLTYNDLATSKNDNDFTNYFVFNKKQLDIWKHKLNNYFDKLKESNQSETNIVRSLIHMTCIRLFGIKSEEEELVENMVWRVLKQKIAMEKYSNDVLILNK